MNSYYDHRKDKRPHHRAIGELLARAPDKPRQKSPTPVEHGRRCDECRNWPTCRPQIGSLYQGCSWCHQPHIGPAFG